MIHQALHRPIPTELTDDERISGRVKRLALVSLVVLGLIANLAVAELGAPLAVEAALIVGWLAMPAVLFESLRRPALRYWLAVPATLVAFSLLAISIGWLPSEPLARAGWLLITAGVLLGGVMGIWLWFRALPVPRSLDDPLSAGRWALVAVHALLVMVGLVMVIGDGALGRVI